MPSVQLTNVNLSVSRSRTASAAAEPPRGSIDLSLSEGIYGLVGRNGSGKSTLLNFIAGRVGAPLVVGACVCSGPVRLLDQSPNPNATLAALFGAQAALADLDAALSGRFGGDMAQVDWTLDDRLRAALDRFGLSDMTLDRRVGTLSGGQRLRAALAACLFDAPEIVLMDEPTNNLDAEGRDLVARALAGHQGVAIVASHDRALLENVDRIVSLEPDGTARVFGGGYTGFAAERDARRARAQAQEARAGAALQRTQADLREAEARKARRARQGRALRDGSQSKLLLDAKKQSAETSGKAAQALARRKEGAAQSALEAARAAVEVVTPVGFALSEITVPAARRLLTIEALEIDAGPHRIGPLDLEMVGPARVEIAGPNGIGKSTVLRAITGELIPRAGRVSRHVRAAYLDQHVGLLRRDMSLLEAASAARPDLSHADLRAELAHAGFRGDHAERAVAALSGGERLRAGLCVVTAGAGTELLLLDEPTNHLDMDTLETLERALTGWGGGVIVVSHDAAFAQAIGVERRVDLANFLQSA